MINKDRTGGPGRRQQEQAPSRSKGPPQEQKPGTTTGKTPRTNPRAKPTHSKTGKSQDPHPAEATSRLQKPTHMPKDAGLKASAQQTVSGRIINLIVTRVVVSTGVAQARPKR